MSNLRDEQFIEIACEYFPAQTRREYAELLQQQAEGGAHTAKESCRRIAEQFVTRKVTARLALKFHLSTLEEVIATMGPQSAKKVLTCGDVLVLELMTALTEAYGRQPPAMPSPNMRRKTWQTSSVN